MAVKRLLVATDLSARSERAIGRAAVIAPQFEAELVLLHVVDDDQPPPLVAAAMRQAEELLRKAASDLGGLKPEVLVRAGDPFEVVVQTAAERAVDLVVMGRTWSWAPPPCSATRCAHRRSPAERESEPQPGASDPASKS